MFGEFGDDNFLRDWKGTEAMLAVKIRGSNPCAYLYKGGGF